MSAYKEVRSLQAWLRRDKKIYRRPSDQLMEKRARIQRANDCTYANPAPHLRGNPEACDRWARRWLMHYNAICRVCGKPLPWDRTRYHEECALAPLPEGA